MMSLNLMTDRLLFPTFENVKEAPSKSACSKTLVVQPCPTLMEEILSWKGGGNLSILKIVVLDFQGFILFYLHSSFQPNPWGLERNAIEAELSEKFCAMGLSNLEK